jgi:hypothetical protein
VARSAQGRDDQEGGDDVNVDALRGLDTLRGERVVARKKKRSPRVRCPFCGEAEELYVDPGGGDAQVYTEDCAVCCRPRVVHVEPGDVPGETRVWLERGE